MPDAGVIPGSMEAMPRLSGLPCVRFSRKVRLHTQLGGKGHRVTAVQDCVPP